MKTLGAFIAVAIAVVLGLTKPSMAQTRDCSGDKERISVFFVNGMFTTEKCKGESAVKRVKPGCEWPSVRSRIDDGVPRSWRGGASTSVEAAPARRELNRLGRKPLAQAHPIPTRP